MTIGTGETFAVPPSSSVAIPQAGTQGQLSSAEQGMEFCNCLTDLEVVEARGPLAAGGDAVRRPAQLAAWAETPVLGPAVVPPGVDTTSLPPTSLSFPAFHQDEPKRSGEHSEIEGSDLEACSEACTREQVVASLAQLTAIVSPSGSTPVPDRGAPGAEPGPESILVSVPSSERDPVGPESRATQLPQDPAATKPDPRAASPATSATRPGDTGASPPSEARASSLNRAGRTSGLQEVVRQPAPAVTTLPSDQTDAAPPQAAHPADQITPRRAGGAADVPEVGRDAGDLAPSRHMRVDDGAAPAARQESAVPLTVLRQENYAPLVQRSLPPSEILNAIAAESAEIARTLETGRPAHATVRVLELLIEPPGVGSVIVRLSMSRNELDLALDVTSRETGQHVEREREALAKLLSSSGVTLESLTVRVVDREAAMQFVDARATGGPDANAFGANSSGSRQHLPAGGGQDGAGKPRTSLRHDAPVEPSRRSGLDVIYV